MTVMIEDDYHSILLNNNAAALSSKLAATVLKLKVFVEIRQSEKKFSYIYSLVFIVNVSTVMLKCPMQCLVIY